VKSNGVSGDGGTGAVTETEEEELDDDSKAPVADDGVDIGRGGGGITNEVGLEGCVTEAKVGGPVAIDCGADEDEATGGRNNEGG
jgi:hypothetical protein